VTTEAAFSKTALTRLASYVPTDRPHLSFVHGTPPAALGTLGRASAVAGYVNSLYGGDGLSQALKAVAGAIVRGIGTKVFWVQIGGFDTHSAQGTNTDNGLDLGLMNTLHSALTALYN